MHNWIREELRNSLRMKPQREEPDWYKNRPAVKLEGTRWICPFDSFVNEESEKFVATSALSMPKMWRGI